MRNEWNVWVVGGDLRQVRLAQLLHEEGHTVHTWALEEAEGVPGPAGDLTEARLADCVVLPLPAAGEDGGLNAPFSKRRTELWPCWTPCGRARWCAPAGCRRS